MSGAASVPIRTAADALIARDYERLEPRVLRTVRGMLVAGDIAFDDADLVAFYNQAWHGVYAKRAADEPIENHAGLLVTIAYRRALDEHRALQSDDGDHLRLRRFVAGLRDRLGERELTAAALCCVHGFTRAGAAELLGVKPKRMEKAMDQVSEQLGALVGEVRPGERSCEDHQPLMKAYALGLLEEGGERHRAATSHLVGCRACRADVLALRAMAAVAPPAPAALPLLGGGLAALGGRGWSRVAAPGAGAPSGAPAAADAARTKDRSRAAAPTAATAATAPAASAASAEREREPAAPVTAASSDASAVAAVNGAGRRRFGGKAVAIVAAGALATAGVAIAVAQPWERSGGERQRPAATPGSPASNRASGAAARQRAPARARNQPARSVTPSTPAPASASAGAAARRPAQRSSSTSARSGAPASTPVTRPPATPAPVAAPAPSAPKPSAPASPPADTRPSRPAPTPAPAPSAPAPSTPPPAASPSPSPPAPPPPVSHDGGGEFGLP